MAMTRPKSCDCLLLGSSNAAAASRGEVNVECFSEPGAEISKQNRSVQRKTRKLSFQVTVILHLDICHKQAKKIDVFFFCSSSS